MKAMQPTTGLGNVSWLKRLPDGGSADSRNFNRPARSDLDANHGNTLQLRTMTNKTLMPRKMITKTSRMIVTPKAKK